MKVAETTGEKAVIEICPLCGSKLEKGYVVSKFAAWSDEKISNWSFKGVFSQGPIISRGYPYLTKNVEAYRCRRCKLVVFQYGEPSNPEEDSS